MILVHKNIQVKLLRASLIFSVFIWVSLSLRVNAQIENQIDDDNLPADIAKTSNLNIPPIPALVLCDLTTNKVIQAGNNRSVKVDWKLGKGEINVFNLNVKLKPWQYYKMMLDVLSKQYLFFIKSMR